jgi:hypothetical protein
MARTLLNHVNGGLSSEVFSVDYCSGAALSSGGAALVI